MASQSNTTSSIIPDWFGLGPKECFGKTCSFGEFCSKDPLYRTCRQCSDIIAWCDVNRTRLAFKYPSCFHICADKAIAKLESKLNETRDALHNFENEVPAWPTLDLLHISLIAGTLFLMLLIVCLFWVTRGRTPRILQKMTHCFPGQKSHHHTAMKTQESAELLPPDIERNEQHVPPQTLHPKHHHHQQNTPPPSPRTHTPVKRPQEDPEDVIGDGRESPEPSAPVAYDTVSMGNPTSSTSGSSTGDNLGQPSTPPHSTRPAHTGSGIPALGFCSTQSEGDRLGDPSRLQAGSGIPASGLCCTQSEGDRLGDNSRLQAGSGISASGLCSTQSEGDRLGDHSRLQACSGISASGLASVQSEGLNLDVGRFGLNTGAGTTSLGYSSVQPEDVVWEGGSGFTMYPVKVKGEAEDNPKMALGRNTYNTDLFASLV